MVAGALLLGGCVAAPPVQDGTGTSPSATPTTASPVTPVATPSPTPTPSPRELPRGGRELFPTYRLFGYSGYPGIPGQGRLGIGRLDDRMKEIEDRGQAFRGGRTLLPVMELIAVTAHRKPGDDGMFRGRVDDQVIARWLDTARKHQALLLLNIQPGRADFLDELKYFEKWLAEPDIGVALDPEWAVEPHQVPGRAFGRTTGAELNDCAAYLSEIVRRHNLPEKVMVYHQLRADIVRDEAALQPHAGVQMIKSIDGIGPPGAKVATWKRIVPGTPEHVHLGFKLFFEEDVERGKRLMTPTEVLALEPEPVYVLFE